MNTAKNAVWVVLMGVSLFLCASCSDSTAPSDEERNPTLAEQNVNDGTTALENELFDMSTGADPETPSDLDFTAAHNHFAAAVANDPTNLSGQFGFALTGILNLTASAEVNGAFAEWELYLENNTPFQTESGLFRPLGIPLTFVSGAGGLRPPLEIVGHALVLNGQRTFMKSEPEFGRIQNIMANEVIPALAAAASRLATVAADPDFTFIVTPRMQGDLEAEELEIDQTDVLVTRAAVHLLSSACRLAVGYDLNFPSYDAAGLVSAFDYDTGTFLHLRSDGAAHLAALETDFEGAVHTLDAAIDALLAETDNQDNDVIKTDPSDLAEQDLRDFQNGAMVDMLALFGDGLEITEDWDNNYSTPEVPLLISAANFMQNPVEDWKSFLPPYVFSTAIAGHYAGSTWDYYSEYRTVESEIAQFAGCSVEYYYDQGVEVASWVFGDEPMLVVAEQIAAEILQQWQADGDWSGSGSMYIYANQQLQAGTNLDVLFQVNTQATNVEWYVIPVFTWSAETFTEWRTQWSNHTLNGLLPGVTSTEELFTIFGYDESSWTREWRIEWYDAELEF